MILSISSKYSGIKKPAGLTGFFESWKDIISYHIYQSHNKMTYSKTLKQLFAQRERIREAQAGFASRLMQIPQMLFLSLFQDLLIS